MMVDEALAATGTARPNRHFAAAVKSKYFVLYTYPVAGEMSGGEAVAAG